MSAFFDPGNESTRHERAIASLTHRAAAPLDEVRALYATELARLGLGAKVHSYLRILTTANVGATLRRAGKIQGNLQRGLAAHASTGLSSSS